MNLEPPCSGTDQTDSSKWGPPNDTNVKDVFGSADWFNFPFWCSETEFTIYAFPDGTSSQDMSDTSQCTYQKTVSHPTVRSYPRIPETDIMSSVQAVWFLSAR